MKKILGLDLGSASIGWAVITENIENNKTKCEILGMGSRIIPYEGTEGKDFAKGTGESRNALRTKARTARKGYDRYQLRRKNLVDVLVKNQMYPDDEVRSLSKMKLWELRDKAVHSSISLMELGRLLLWLNQKRGYKSSRSDANLGKKDTEYVATVKSRHEKIKDLNLTIGQYFYKELSTDEFFKVKENIFPREAYIEEFDAICGTQKESHPEVLTNDLIDKIRNEIIYYQRPLKSQKGLVSVCEFEGFWRIGKDGKEYFVGPKVAPKSSPLFQLAKMWENINNIKLGSRTGEDLKLTTEQKWAIFQHLDNNEKLMPTDLLKILNLKKDDCYVNKQLAKGLIGNITKHAIRQCLGGSDQYENLLKFELKVVENEKEGYLYDRKTGEVLNSKPIKFIDPLVEEEPFYKLWHTIYSIHDQEECSQAFQTKFNIEKPIADKLASIDFSKHAIGNKSAKVIRKILPYLMEGDGYSEAMSYAGYDHSNSQTKEENLQRKLLEQLKPIPKNSLRQPIVEKILNQMVNVVNAVIKKYGKPDEIRVELARELKLSKEERNDVSLINSANERINEEVSNRLKELNLPATKRNIEKYKFIYPIRNVITKEGKIDSPKLKNAIVRPQCIYCGQMFSLTDALNGKICDVDHIIPKALLFDDSQTNKVLVHRKCNQADKSDKTAFDFIRAKGNEELENYLTRVDEWYKLGILSYSKRLRLLASHEDYLLRKIKNKETEADKKLWETFINRQAKETQYISKKSIEMLKTVCRNVWCTSGTVTAELRHLWGWDDVTMNLQMLKYKELGLTEMVEWESEHGKYKHQKEVITGWTKRDDHRHHAVDALTIACTKQGFIQRFNTLSATKTREDMMFDVEQRSLEFKEKRSLLEKYIIGEQPLTVDEVQKAVSNILISFKSGKKVAVWGTRKIGKRGSKKVIQEKIIVPRGSLSEESVYGKIKIQEADKPIKYLFENPQLIFNSNVKAKVEERLLMFDGDVKKAIASLKKVPIYLDNEKTVVLEKATCLKDEYVIKYTVDTNFNKTDKVVDPKIKEILQSRLKKFGGKEKEAFKDVQLEDKTVIKWYEDEGLERPIKSVRCFTGLSAVVPVKKDENGNNIGFVKPGNNHHIAIYTDTEENKQQHVCTFWHAVERKKYGVPVIIKNTNEVWDMIQSQPDGTYPESFLEMLPPPNVNLLVSMQQNEMFILGMTTEDIEVAIKQGDYRQISDKLYRVQKLGSGDYTFRHHLETQIVDDNNAMLSKRGQRIRSIGSLFALNPFKVRIDNLGNIVKEN